MKNPGFLHVEEKLMESAANVAKPWYREPWPWLLMAGPTAVIVAGVATVWIAVVSSDGLVVDDYYKQGLAINQTLERGALAAARGYRAAATLANGGRNISLQFRAAAADVPLPDMLQLRIAHPTRAGRDGLVLLRRRNSRLYEGVGPVLTAGRWNLVLEDVQSSWRLAGSIVMSARTPATLSP